MSKCVKDVKLSEISNVKKSNSWIMGGGLYKQECLEALCRITLEFVLAQ